MMLGLSHRHMSRTEPASGLLFWFGLALAMMIAFGSTMAAGTAQARAAPQSFADLTEKLLPSVVNIATTQIIESRSRWPDFERPQLPPGSPFEKFFKDFFENEQRGERPRRRAQSLGSGFIIDDSGIIVTNNHVIAEAEEIRVRLQNDTEFEATVLGRDPKTDIALLKIDPDGAELTAVQFGNSDRLRVGDWVLAIGNPFGLGGTVTAGIVSARGRDINQGPYDDFIQTDASINKGNSGGPLFDLEGRVVGVNTAIFSQSGGSVGIGFAVAAALAEPVVTQLRDHGRIRRGWLGVRIQTVTDEIAESVGLDDAVGALVAQVPGDGPAKAANIEPGDVILSFNEHEIETMRQLPRFVAEAPIGVDVPVEIWRDGDRLTVTVRVGELKDDDASGPILTGSDSTPTEPENRWIDPLGLELSSLTEPLRERYLIEGDVQGTVITEIDADGPAAEKRLQPGDVIAEVDQTEIGSAAEVARIVDDVLKTGRKNSVLLTVNRQGSVRYVGIRMKKS